jgi:hypothetical protein
MVDALHFAGTKTKRFLPDLDRRAASFAAKTGKVESATVVLLR